MTLMPNPRTRCALAALLAAAATACAPSAAPGQPAVKGGPASSGQLHVTATDFDFQPRTIQVPAGRPLTIKFENEGVMVHDWVVGGTDMHLSAAAGGSQEKTLTFDRPGEYDITCSIPYHTEFGMKGKLVVLADASAAAQAVPEAAPPLPAGLSRLPLPEVAPPVARSASRTVPVELEAREVDGLVADGVGTTFWTFGGTIPGPMVRVRQGDTVKMTLKNAMKSRSTHSIDFHAATGPGGGGKATQIPPGGTAEISFKALNPGVYVYHCATPKVAAHIANGMYGLIVVEPPEGLPKVDREFYAMQGDFYLKGDQPGMRAFSYEKMLAEQPDYVLINGSVGAISGERAFKAKVGETVRIFFGVGGPNLTSSFHVIGEIFDRLYPEGGSVAQRDVQTTLVPAGGAVMAELKLEAPGAYALVDHSLGRLEKGAAGILMVDGAEQPEVFQAISNRAGEAGHGDHGH